jgi:SAM-dependent methyltransferase
LPKLDFGYVESVLKHTEKGGLAEEWDLPYWRHLHWGLYESPNPPEHTLATYYAATVAMTEHVVAAGNVGDGSHVLDVGCGLGGTLDHIRGRNPGSVLVGVNVDERQVSRATELLGRSPTGHQRISFVTADGCRLPVADDSMDHVLAVECLFHFPSRRQFFREAARVLRPGGTLALSDFVVPKGFVGKVMAKAKLERPIDPSVSRPDTLRAAVGQGNGSMLDVVSAWVDSDARAADTWWGSAARPLTSGAYERLGRGAGFELLVDDDVTERTLPTYEAFHHLYEASRAHGGVLDEETSVAGLQSGDSMADAARSGDWQYHVLSFRRRS